MSKRSLAVIWTICLIAISLQILRPQNTRGPYSYWHETEHIVTFGGTALIFRALIRRNWLTLAGVFLLAVFIEAAQLIIYRMVTGFEWWDVVEDMVGAALAILLVSILRVIGIRTNGGYDTRS